MKINLGDVPALEPGERDAVHVAAVALVAGEQLRPGQHVGMVGVLEVGHTSTHFGIVDPYRKGNIPKGAKVWVLPYPGSIHAIRHQWEHAVLPADNQGSPQHKAAEVHLRLMAANRHLEYHQLLADVLSEDPSHFEDDLKNDPHFRESVELMTGKKINPSDFDDGCQDTC